MEFNSKTFNEFRKDFDAAVKALEQKYAVKLDLGTINYREIDFTARITGTSVTAEGKKAVDMRMFALNSLALKLGAPLGYTFKYAGKQYTVSDINTRRSKPVQLTTADGKICFAPADLVNMCYDANKEPE